MQCRHLQVATVVNKAPCHPINKFTCFQWGEMPTSVAYIGTGQIMGWGNKAIEVRSIVIFLCQNVDSKFPLSPYRFVPLKLAI